MIVRVKLFPETKMSRETLGDEKELSPGGKTRDEFPNGTIYCALTSLPDQKP